MVIPTFALLLVASALLLGFVLGPVLDRLSWTRQHPGSAALCWFGAVVGTISAATGLAIVALLSPPAPVHGLLDWADNCLPHHGATAIAAASVASLVLVGFCGLRLTRALPRLWRALRHRRHHREMLGFVAREDELHDDVLLIDHPLPVAYCMRMRGRQIVLSTGALDQLSDAQVGAVLAHERAHLRQRHHVVVIVVDLAYALLPWLPTLRGAQIRIPQLLEMAADDSAARDWGRHTVIAALYRLGAALSPPGALAAGEPAVDKLQERVVRLRSSTVPERGVHGLAVLTSATTVAVPLVALAVSLAELPLPC